MKGPNDDQKELAGEVLKLRQLIDAYEVRESASRMRTRRIEELSSLKEDLLRSGALQEKLKRITDGLVEVFDADFARIWITKPGDLCDSGCVHAKTTKGPHVCKHRDRCLHLLASSGRYTHIDGEVHGRVPFGCYMIGRVAAGLEPKFLTNDVTQDTRIHDQDWAGSLGLISFAGFGLLSKEGTPIGVLALFSKHELSQDDAVMLEDMANTASQVIQTAMAEEARGESENRYRSLVEASPDPIVMYDLQGNLITVNQQAAAMYGVGSPEELLAEIKSVFDVLDEESQRRGAANFELTLATGSSRKNEYTLIRKDGISVPIEINSSTISGADGTPLAFISIIRDITDRNKTDQKMRESEERFRSTFEQAAVGICHVSPEGRFLRVNQKLCAILGYTSDELLSLNLHSITHPDDFESDLEYVRQVLADEIKTYSMEKRFLRKDGSQPWANLTVSLTRDTSGVPQYFIWVVEDISSRKIAENALRQSEDKFRSIVENSLAGMFTVDEAYHFIYVNDELCRVLGRSRESLLGSDFRKVLSDDSRALVAERYIRRQRGETVPPRYEIDVVRGDGKTRHVEMRIAVVRDASGLTRTMGQLIDVTEGKLAEEWLRIERERFQMLSDRAPLGMAMIAEDGTFEYVNPKFTEIFGYDLSDVSDGREWLRKAHPDRAYRDKVVAAWREDLEGLAPGGQGSRVFEVTCKDGSQKTIQFLTVKLRKGEDLMTCEDITDRMRAEQALRESEEKYRTLFEESKDAVYITTSEGILLNANQAFLDLFGFSREEAGNMEILQIYTDAADRKRFQEEIEQKGSLKDYEISFRKKDGTKIESLLTATLRRDNDGAILGYHGIVRDVTERKQLQRQFLQAQKMEAIGQLAGGVAHDFNNILTAIIGYTDVLTQQIPEDSPYRNKVMHINSAGARAAHLTRQLLAFSRKQILDLRPLKLNEVIANFQRMLRPLIREDIEVVTLLDQSAGTVMGDATQIEQILLNLAINARDAMPKGGKLTVETANIYLDEAYVRTHSEVRSGPYVMVAVSDTGHGIDPDVLPRVFDPFFTTKAKEKGTGLGLSTVYGIVKQHQGHVTAYSEPGRGTTFKVYLPLVQNASEQATSVQAATPRFTGTETVLVVEDEEIVRQLTSEVLETLGYRVLQCRDPGEAIGVSEVHKGPIHLLLTDVVLPQMDGKSLFGYLSPLFPDMRVLYVSGYAQNAIFHHGVLDAGVKFLQKPFNVESLAKKVREVLDAP
ncbi:MAG: PAS domain S-box protein [Desulfomonilaceae bacterium]